jgi:hypothetical protein
MIRYLLDPTRAGFIFAAIVILSYVLVPIWFYLQTGMDNGYTELALIAATASGAIALGFLGREGKPLVGKLELELGTFIAMIWIPFLITAALIVATAPAIPLLTALRGGSPDLIALQREEFLKSREGLAGVFVYLNAFFTGAIVPYSIALMFVNKFRYRWLLTILFLVYSLSFVEKAFFLKVLLPLLYLFSTGMVRSKFGPKTTISVSMAILLFVTTISGAGSADTVGTSADFFSATYAPSSPFAHIVWRSLAVPVFTAADALRVFDIYFDGHALYGATSSFVASVSGMKRILFERIVFEFQWGQNETGTGSSNSVYITEAFVNFRWIGVVVFSLFIGRSLRVFAQSRDEAFRSIWPLYVMGLYSSGLLGQLLSNGFILLLIIGAFVHVRPQVASNRNVGKEFQWEK